MKTEADYKKLSAWMLTVITHPKGVRSGASLAANQGLSSKPIEAIINPSNKLDSVARISIYQRAYYARLLDCFQVEYPVLKKLLGVDIFKAFVFEYLQRHPSSSYTLNQLGAQFPAYLAQTQPNQKSSDSKQPTWVTLILEIANLERAYTEIYDGPGHEKEVLPNANQLLKLDLNDFAKLKLVPANCLRLFSFQHDLLEYFLAVRKGLTPEELPPKAQTWVALTRQQYNLRFFKLSAMDYALLQSFFEGHSIEESLNQLGKDYEVSLIILRSRICILADEGFFQSYH